MSHFTVMIIGDEPENQLAPFQENNMGDCPIEFMEFQEDDDCNIDKSTGKKGYWNNPNSKWDWFTLGGRWSGMIKLKDGAIGETGESGTFGNKTGIDQAKKGDIANFDDLKTFALLKDGKWFEKGKMGWWGVVHDKKDEDLWETELKKLVEGLPDETLISIYDCHI